MIHRLLPFILLASVLSGCGGGPKLAAVKGTVTLDDKPLVKGTITFETEGQRPATGRIVNGEIVELTTYKAGDGVPLGAHRVAITATADAASAVTPDPGKGKGPGADYMVGKSLIPEAYNDPVRSKLTAQVEAGENTVAFKLSSKGP